MYFHCEPLANFHPMAIPFSRKESGFSEIPVSKSWGAFPVTSTVTPWVVGFLVTFVVVVFASGLGILPKDASLPSLMFDLGGPLCPGSRWKPLLPSIGARSHESNWLPLLLCVPVLFSLEDSCSPPCYRLGQFQSHSDSQVFFPSYIIIFYVHFLHMSQRASILLANVLVHSHER